LHHGKHPSQPCEKFDHPNYYLFLTSLLVCFNASWQEFVVAILMSLWYSCRVLTPLKD
jgi:hypothetical protein